MMYRKVYYLAIAIVTLLQDLLVPVHAIVALMVVYSELRPQEIATKNHSVPKKNYRLLVKKL